MANNRRFRKEWGSTDRLSEIDKNPRRRCQTGPLCTANFRLLDRGISISIQHKTQTAFIPHPTNVPFFFCFFFLLLFVYQRPKRITLIQQPHTSYSPRKRKETARSPSNRPRPPIHPNFLIAASSPAHIPYLSIKTGTSERLLSLSNPGQRLVSSACSLLRGFRHHRQCHGRLADHRHHVDRRHQPQRYDGDRPSAPAELHGHPHARPLPELHIRLLAVHHCAPHCILGHLHDLPSHRCLRPIPSIPLAHSRRNLSTQPRDEVASRSRCTVGASYPNGHGRVPVLDRAPADDGHGRIRGRAMGYKNSSGAKGPSHAVGHVGSECCGHLEKYVGFTPTTRRRTSRRPLPFPNNNFGCDFGHVRTSVRHMGITIGKGHLLGRYPCVPDVDCRRLPGFMAILLASRHACQQVDVQ